MAVDYDVTAMVIIWKGIRSPEQRLSGLILQRREARIQAAMDEYSVACAVMREQSFEKGQVGWRHGIEEGPIRKGNTLEEQPRAGILKGGATRLRLPWSSSRSSRGRFD